MRSSSKLLVATGLAVALAGIATSASAAAVFNILNPERGFRIAWASLTFEAGTRESTLSCAVTLEGTFTRTTIAKTPGSQIGAVTSAAIAAPCTGGSARALTERLPWTVSYASFTGTLPRITSITLDIVGAAFAMIPTGSTTCLATSEAGHPLVGMASIREIGSLHQSIETLRLDETRSIPISFESCILLHTNMKLSGVGTMSVGGGTAKTVYMLI